MSVTILLCLIKITACILSCYDSFFLLTGKGPGYHLSYVLTVSTAKMKVAEVEGLSIIFPGRGF